MTIQSAQEFITLRSSDDREMYDRAAREDAPLEIWLELIERHPAMRKWVAYNKTVPLEILDTLANDEDYRVRAMVAMRRKLSPELLRRLAGDSDEGVRLLVVKHRNTPRDVLEALLSDSWDAVRQEAAKRLA